jgi:hypothetical protein
LWIEFEVSRADPVANHAKFATAHLFQPQRPDAAAADGRQAYPVASGGTALAVDNKPCGAAEVAWVLTQRLPEGVEKLNGMVYGFSESGHRK